MRRPKDQRKRLLNFITRSLTRTETCLTRERANEWARGELGQSVLGGLHQIVDMDVDVIVVFDVVHSGLSRDLVDDQARPLHAVICDVLHLFTHKTLWLLTRLPVCR